MAWPVLPHGFLGAQGSENDNYQIQRSLRFNSADSAYLNRTPASAGNRKTWTWSGWVKRSTLGGAQYFLGNAQAPSGTNGIYLGFSADNIFFGDYGASAWDWYVETSSVYRDVSAWYHLVVQYDTTQSTASERIKLYVNGNRVTGFNAATYPSLNVDGRFNQASVEMAIGRLGTYNGNYFNGYLTEINFIDGQALTPSSFGETDAITGRWKAKAYSGTYGTNGFYLPFSDNSSTTALGYDKSGTYGVSTLTTGGTPSADSALSTYTASLAFDGLFRTTVSSDKWIRGSTGNGGFLRYQLSSGKVVKAYRIYGYSDSPRNEQAPNSWVFQGSNDGTNWTTLDTQSSVSWASSLEIRKYDISNTTSYTYYQIASLTTPNTGHYITVYEFELYEAGTNGFNNWTPNNFSVTAGVGNDSLLDSPTNNGTSGNYCTFNAIASNLTQGTLYNGNLEIQGQGSVMNTVARGNMAILGKAYAEFYFDVVSAYACIGVVPLRDTAANDGILWSTSTNLSYRSNGNKRIMGTETAYGATWVANNVIGVAVDSSANTVEFFKNGVSQGVITSSAFFAQGDCTFAVATDDVGSPRGYANFGQRPFAYTAPAGFKALCTTNLPTPTIKKPSSYMDVVTYTGNGTYPRTIGGLGFQPDLVWIKARPTTYSHILYDSVRGTGTGANLSSNETGAEGANSSYANLTAFTSDGFTVGSTSLTNVLNNNTTTFVAWAWDEAPIAGMDIVVDTTPSSYADKNYTHNLGVAPSFVIYKERTGTANWWVWHKSISPASNAINLNTTGSVSSGSYWGTHSSTIIAAKSGIQTSFSVGVVLYAFAEVEGFSKFGKYSGNSSTDGPFIWCGFRPRWLMIKNITASDVYSSWLILDTQRDTYNTSVNTLWANMSSSEGVRGNGSGSGSSIPIDILSNGFKPRNSGSESNSSGSDFIFAAFAESPFKYARAR